MNRARTSKKISAADVKLCVLCGTLNFHHNAECWTCRWRGDFSRDAQTIALAWQRLETQYEDVRIDHLVARQSAVLGDFGAVRPVSLPQRALAKFAAWRHGWEARRDLRQAQRAARGQSKMPSPPDQLGV